MMRETLSAFCVHSLMMEPSLSRRVCFVALPVIVLRATRRWILHKVRRKVRGNRQ